MTTKTMKTSTMRMRMLLMLVIVFQSSLTNDNMFVVAFQQLQQLQHLHTNTVPFIPMQHTSLSYATKTSLTLHVNKDQERLNSNIKNSNRNDEKMNRMNHVMAKRWRGARGGTTFTYSSSSLLMAPLHSSNDHNNNSESNERSSSKGTPNSGSPKKKLGQKFFASFQNPSINTSTNTNTNTNTNNSTMVAPATTSSSTESSSVPTPSNSTSNSNSITQIKNSTSNSNNEMKTQISLKLLLQTTTNFIKFITKHTKQTISNFFFHPQFGKRGEAFIIMEIIFAYAMIVAKIPLLNDLIIFLFGPGFLLSGLIMVFASLKEFYVHNNHNDGDNVIITRLNTTTTIDGTSTAGATTNMKSIMKILALATPIMTAYTNPIPTSSVSSLTTTEAAATTTTTTTAATTTTLNQLSNSNSNNNNRNLITTGIYSYIRHPFYTGILCSFIGSSIISKSIERLIISAFYFILIQYKCQKEEHELFKVYKNLYMNYEHKVRGRFLPTKKRIQSMVEKLVGNVRSSGSSGLASTTVSIAKPESNPNIVSTTSTTTTNGVKHNGMTVEETTIDGKATKANGKCLPLIRSAATLTNDDDNNENAIEITEDSGKPKPQTKKRGRLFP